VGEVHIRASRYSPFAKYLWLVNLAQYRATVAKSVASRRGTASASVMAWQTSSDRMSSR